MTTLTEAMVEVADCHTTLYHLGAAAPPNAPLPLGSAENYNGLYEKVAAPKRVPYGDVSGQQGVVLDRLSAVYRKNNYWNSFFANEDLTAYPFLAWDFVAPILCSLKTRIEFVPNEQFDLQVSPLPSVLLYPFGWSNWLSLRVRGEFTLQDLANFNHHLLTQKSFRPDPASTNQQPSTFSVRELFAKMSEGVRADAFGAHLTKDFAPKDLVLVTTVLEKNGGTLALDGLDTEEQKILLRVVKPDGPPPSKALLDHVHRLQPSGEEKYVVMENYGRFTWLEDRLQPVNRNYQHLRCYHNNTFNSLVHARHLYQLLTQAVKLKALTPPLTELTDKANANLASPSDYYENASLRGFLLDPSVADVRKKMEKFDQKKDG